MFCIGRAEGLRAAQGVGVLGSGGALGSGKICEAGAMRESPHMPAEAIQRLVYVRDEALECPATPTQRSFESMV